MKGEAGMSHREHATVKAMQSTGSDRAMDGRTRITERPGQLVERHNSMLSLCEIRKASVRLRVRRTLVSHSDIKVRRTLFLPRFPR